MSDKLVKALSRRRRYMSEKFDGEEDGSVTFPDGRVWDPEERRVKRPRRLPATFGAAKRAVN